MNRDIVEYLEDSFIDYKGIEHKLVACAVSTSPKAAYDTLAVGWADEGWQLDEDATICNKIVRTVTVAIAVCNPDDQYDLEKGKRCAYNKAINQVGELPTLYAAHHGIISTPVVKAFLQQEMKFSKDNPELLIPGYNNSKARWEAAQAFEKEVNDLGPLEKHVVDLFRSGIDIEKYSNIAKKLGPNVVN